MDLSKFSFLDGTIVEPGVYRFVALQDDLAAAGRLHGVILTYRDGVWKGVSVAEGLVACAADGLGRFVAIAESGREIWIHGSELKQGLVAAGIDSPTSNGPLTQVARWGAVQWLAVGTGRQAYRRNASDWERVDRSCKPRSPEERAEVAFLSVDGFHDGEAYAVGWNGEVWTFDGISWLQRPSLTNLSLHGVTCAQDGAVYACGQVGTILKGRGDSWAAVDHTDTEEDLRDICWHVGSVYVCSTNLLYRVRGRLVEQVADAPIASTGRLDVCDDVLLSTGLKEVWTLDGSRWTKLV